MKMPRYLRLELLLPAAIFAALVFPAAAVRAQQAPPSAPPPQAQAQQTSPSLPPSDSGRKEESNAPAKKSQEQQTGTSNERLFWVFPDFLLIRSSKQLPPLSVGAKFKVAARGSFDYVEFPLYGLAAGISQVDHNDPAYGQGAAGYARRYASAFADGTIESFMTNAVLPSILRQDPRYYQLGKGGFFHRTGYAITWDPPHPRRFGKDSVQLFRNSRQCSGRRHFHLHLSSAQRTLGGQCIGSVGRATAATTRSLV